MAKILLVDDDPMQAYRRKFNLERQYKDVERVSNAAEALCLVEQPQYAAELGLVIVALRMPGMSGPEFVRELHTRMPALPVLALGHAGETADEYTSGRYLRFLPGQFEGREMLTLAGQLLEQNTSPQAEASEVARETGQSYRVEKGVSPRFIHANQAISPLPS